MTTVKGFGQDRAALEMHGPGTSGKRRGNRTQAKLAGQHSTFREIGVGTNDPAKATHILRETAGAGVLVERIETSTGAGSFQGRKSRGTEAARTAVASGDDLLSIEGIAYVGANNGYQPGARITYEVDGSVSDAEVGAPTRMTFLVATGSGSSLDEKMRITSTGKVGIGMNDPSTKLTVEGAVTLKEQAAADADVGAYGQVWVKTATPNQLYFTTDAGDDIQITSGTALASTYSAGDGLDLTGTTFSTDLKANGGLVIESTELAVDLGASSVTGTLAVGDGGSGQTSYTNGQLLIGNTTGNTLAKATLTASTGISITNGTGTVTIASNLEGTELVSTGEGGGSKFLREDGDGTCSWQTVSGGGGGMTSFQLEDGDGTEVTINDAKEVKFVEGGGIDINWTDVSPGSDADPYDLTFTVADTTVAGDSGSTGITPGDTLTIAGGTNCATAMSGDTLTVNSTDTNTTYSAGTLLDLATTTFNVDLTEAAEAVMANGDYILFLDGGATGSHAKEAIADVATLFAGDGLTASASVMAVNVDDSTIETNSDAIRVKDNGVTLAKMAGLARGKIIHGDASGDPAALAVGSANTVLQSDGTDSSWGTVATAMIADNAVSLAKMAGLARGKIIYGDASGDPAALALGDADQVLTHDGTDISWEDAGGGGGVSLSGTTNNTIATVTGSNALIGEANLTFDGNSLAITTGSASAIACTITAAGSQTADLLVVENSSNADMFKITNDGDLEFGTSGTGIIRRENATGTNTVGGGVHLRGGKSTGNALGGEVRFYTAPAGSSGSSVNNHAEAVVIDGNKVVDFKIAEVVDSGSDYQYDNKVLTIKVNGTEYFLQLYVEASGGGGGMP